MARPKKGAVNLSANAFGKLVTAYREQREWSQEELAERWGYSREYVSQIERGKRKLTKTEQVNRLADILEIPQERLEAIGKGIPQRQAYAQNVSESDDVLLQTLLEPAQTNVKLSWLIWRGDSIGINVEHNLYDLEQRLKNVLEAYRGQFYQPALHLLGSVYEILGKFAIERAATQEAIQHFQSMYDIAEELTDPNLLTLSIIHQAEMLRRRNRYEASFKRMESAEKYLQKHGNQVLKHIHGALWRAYAITYFSFGDEQGFLRTIDQATSIAEKAPITLDTASSEFDKVKVLQVKAQGYTQLWKPARALDIYKETDKLRPFRPIRDQSSYDIVKAQAHCYVGDTETGINYALKGMKIAEDLQAVRYVIRLRQMSERLDTTAIGKLKVMRDMGKEIQETLIRMKY